MEQDERLYEYKMGSEVYRFEARTHAEAEAYRGIAIQFFAERLATLFSEEALIGPEVVDLPEAFQTSGERFGQSRSFDAFPGP